MPPYEYSCLWAVKEDRRRANNGRRPDPPRMRGSRDLLLKLVTSGLGRVFWCCAPCGDETGGKGNGEAAASAVQVREGGSSAAGGSPCQLRCAGTGRTEAT